MSIRLRELIDHHAAPEELAFYLDELTHEQRLQLVMEMTRSDLRGLYHNAHGATPISLEHFVPQGVDDLQEVIHWGRNSLVGFRAFQKRFCRPPTEDGVEPVLWGYNEQTMRTFTGPGYFIARRGIVDTPVWIDYCRLPPGRAPSWPPILPNSSRLSRVIYYGTIDRMRRVSNHVSIGAAYRNNKPMGAYFVLCRQDP